ncbi:FMN-binding protein [Herbiconiux sp. YIM B11900]|uniref:FMN-binding protein n=1 Tax=Herbiconiux sp. YIM B11900 TaxID=3404131 RepID=UPI003F87A07D
MITRQKKLALATMTGLSITVALAGCASDSDAATTGSTETTTPSTAAGTPSASSSATATDGSASGTDDTAASTYTDGTYDATGTYTSPNGKEEIDVSLTLEGDIITAVTVTPEATNPNSVNYQNQFADGIAEVVVGKDIDEIEVSRVAGSSLTSGGFNEAVETIKSEAA